MQTWSSAVWRDAEFLDGLHDFVASAMGEPVVLEEARIGPWSAVWRAKATHQVGYVKQNCPGQQHEARLVVRLAELAPAYVVPVLAADPGRDLLLTADLGATLAETGGADEALWARILRDGSLLQRAVAPHAEALCLTRLTPDVATTYFADAVGRLAALPEGDPRRLAETDALRLRDLLPAVGRWADQVAELALPATLNHNDLHSANVVAPAYPRAPLRFFDFGDAVLSDPLSALLIPLRMISSDLGYRPDDPRLLRLADAALEVWSDLVPIRRLRAALPAALQLGRLARVEAWRRCVATMNDPDRQQYGASPAAWLTTLTDAPPYLAAPPM